MRKRDRKELGRYIRALADEMGLRDWQIVLAEEPCTDASAEVEITYGRRVAAVSVPTDFRNAFTPEAQRDSIVHELVHVHLESMANMVQNDLEPLLGRPADSVFFAGFQRQYEYGVDGLTGALAHHMPLIEWPEPKERS